MKRLDLYTTQEELQKRWLYPYNWYRKQNDLWDRYSKFIYSTATWENLIPEIKAKVNAYELDKKHFFYYSINRWYNFWSAKAVEQIFCSNKHVTAAKNAKDRHIDFYIDGVSFDHKTSVFPKGFAKTLDYAKAHEKELILWFYKNQSQEQRRHYKNRLFVVVYAKDGQHWKLKANLEWLQDLIGGYLNQQQDNDWKSFSFITSEVAKAGVIWAVET